MASTHKSLRSGTANKRPTTAIADGQIALNTNSTSPGLFFKDSTGATIIKIGPVHVGATAPNVSPAAGGSSGNSTGEIWLDNSLTPVGVKIWNGSAWVNATPIGSTTVQGLLELATDAETQAGSDTARAVTPASLQSKVSDSTSTTSSTTIASSTAVKSAYDLANAALPKSGGTVTGNLEIGNTGSLSFEGATADGFETTIAITDPTADRTITLPDTTGTVVLNTGAQTVQFGLGAAATPSITFTGDTNTGIYSPGANQVAISTNGTGRLFVDANGNVGLGTSAPENYGAEYFTVEARGTSANGGGIFQTRSFDGTVKAYFYVDSSTNTGRIGTVNNFPFLFATNSVERLRLDTNGGFQFKGAGTAGVTQAVSFNGSAPANSLVIDSSGRVGLGTSSPSAPLHLSTGATAASALFASTDTIAYSATSFSSGARLRITSGNATSAYNGIGFGNNSNAEGFIGFVQNASGYGDFVVQSYAGSYGEKLRVTSAGNVGIGTNSPSSLLHLVSSGQPTITVADDAGRSLQVKAPDSSANPGFIGTTTNHDFLLQAGTTAGGLNVMRFNTAGSERARIDSSGRLLVGTSTYDANGVAVFQGVAGDPTGPGALDLRRGTTRPAGADTSIGYLRFMSTSQTSSNYHYAYIAAFTDGTSSSDTDIPGRLSFATTADGASSPTERMRIPNGGGLCIGSTVNPNALTQTSGIRLGGSTIASNDFIDVTTTPVTIANGVGIGGMGFVQAYNTSTGAQYTGIIMWRSGIVAVVSESNALGFALTYSVSGSTLRLQTASGTVTGSIISLGS